MSDQEFRILASAEFNKLSQAEKMEYLARAVAVLNAQSLATHAVDDSPELDAATP